MENIHDKTIKERLSDKENAIAFLETALPSEVRAMLDLSTLTLENKTFVTEELKELFADLIYSCKLIENDDLYCSILIEHKSYKDPFTSFQIMSYISASYAEQIKQKEKLKIVIPLLFSHQNGNWEYKTIRDYFLGYPEILKKYIPDHYTILFDAGGLSDEDIFLIKNLAIATMLMTQKYGPTDFISMLRMLQRIYDLLANDNERGSFLVNIRYSFIAYVKNKSELAKVKSIISEPLNQIGMSLVAECIEEGIGIGREQGIEIGEENAKKEMVIFLHQAGQSIAFIAEATKFSMDKVVEIIETLN